MDGEQAWRLLAVILVVALIVAAACLALMSWLSAMTRV